jgi:ureidoacrylate peracid hydrolase
MEMESVPLPPISLNNTALVIHDMQNDFIKESLATPEMREVVKRVRALIDLAHSLPIPVIYTRYEGDPAIGYLPERAPYFRYSGAEICLKGSPGADIIDELRPTPDDHVITKVRYSGFHGTRLETLLAVKGVWILIAAGGSTNWGVEWLARDARSRDMITIALRDCTYSLTAEAQAASLANVEWFLGHVMDSSQVVEILSKLKKS